MSNWYATITADLIYLETYQINNGILLNTHTQTLTHGPPSQRRASSTKRPSARLNYKKSASILLLTTPQSAHPLKPLKNIIYSIYVKYDVELISTVVGKEVFLSIYIYIYVSLYARMWTNFYNNKNNKNKNDKRRRRTRRTRQRQRRRNGAADVWRNIDYNIFCVSAHWWGYWDVLHHTYPIHIEYVSVFVRNFGLFVCFFKLKALTTPNLCIFYASFLCFKYYLVVINVSMCHK